MPAYFFHVEFELYGCLSADEILLAGGKERGKEEGKKEEEERGKEKKKEKEKDKEEKEKEEREGDEGGLDIGGVGLGAGAVTTGYTERGISAEATSASSVHIVAPGTDIFRARLPDTRRAAGVAGAAGTAGVAGITGATGVTGATGATGVKGSSVLQGSRDCSLRGDWGFQEKGPKGNVSSEASNRGANDTPIGSAKFAAPAGPTAVTEPEKTRDRSLTRGISERNRRVRDWRFGAVSIESIDMRRAAVPASKKSSHGSDGSEIGNKGSPVASAAAGPATLGQFVPAETATTDVGWGVVHLYRDAKETVGIAGNTTTNTSRRDINTKDSKSNNAGNAQDGSFREKDCTTLCILAVPSYMTSSDLLGFVGERTREDVSHFRLIRTARTNKYMVLMKFRDAGRARVWQREWNGKLFNSMEVCCKSPPTLDQPGSALI